MVTKKSGVPNCSSKSEIVINKHENEMLSILCFGLVCTCGGQEMQVEP